jgi:hypothetical protein
MSVTRKQIAKAFKVALAHQWDGKCYADLYGSDTAHFDKFICHGLDRVPSKAGRAAAKIIEHRLEGELCLETWLVNKKDIDWMQHTHEKIQTTRKAWLKSLIEEFSK